MPRKIRNEDALPVAMLLAIGGQLDFHQLSADMERIVGEMRARGLADPAALKRISEAARLVGKADRLGISSLTRTEASAAVEPLPSAAAPAAVACHADPSELVKDAATMHNTHPNRARFGGYADERLSTFDPQTGLVTLAGPGGPVATYRYHAEHDVLTAVDGDEH